MSEEAAYAAEQRALGKKLVRKTVRVITEEEYEEYDRRLSDLSSAEDVHGEKPRRHELEVRHQSWLLHYTFAPSDASWDKILSYCRTPGQ